MLGYLIYSLFDFAEANIKMHLLLFKLTAFLIEQVGIMVDEVQVVTWSDGHGATTTLCQAVICLLKGRRNWNLKALIQKNSLSKKKQKSTNLNSVLY